MQKDDFYSYLNILVNVKNYDMFLYFPLIILDIAGIMLIGMGNIGKELQRRLVSTKLNHFFPLYSVKNDGLYSYLGTKVGEKEEYANYIDKIDAVCLAIPTADDGKIALDYITTVLKSGKPVVTCEKGALSNFFEELEPNLKMIGHSASVGGGTRLLQYTKQRMNSEVEQIHAIINGTLNYVFEEVSRGRSLGEVVLEAKKLGYAEPGAETPLDVINMEAHSDLPMKTAILFNVLELGKLKAKDFKCNKMDDEDLRRLVRESRKRRYIVSISRECPQEDIIGGFTQYINGWYIVAGFKKINENPLFMQLAVSGVNNSLLMYEGKYGINGTYRLSGQGAGAGPTTTAMLLDLEQLLREG